MNNCSNCLQKTAMPAYCSVFPVGSVLISSLSSLQHQTQSAAKAQTKKRKATKWTDPTLKIVDFYNFRLKNVLRCRNNSEYIFTYKSSSGGSNSLCGFSTVEQHSHSQHLIDCGQNHANSFTLQAKYIIYLLRFGIFKSLSIYTRHFYNYVMKINK